MANNNADIKLLAGLGIDSSETEILKAIKIIEKRLKANTNAKIKLKADIDETVIKNTVEKLQNILKGKELKIETQSSIKAITKEVDAMTDVITVAKKASNEKLEFAKANERVRNSADDTTDAVNRERNAMNSLGDVETILNGINNCGTNGNSVFQKFGNTFRDAFSTYTTVNFLEQGLNKVVDAGKEAIEIVKEFDDINVDLQLASGEDKGYVKQLLKDYAELGGELGILTQDVAESADTFLRQGRSIEDTNHLIEDSIVLSKIAKTDGENSSEILTATINGFKMAANEGSKVNDVLSSIDLNSSSDASGIGSALTKVASMANNAGVSLEKTAAIIATIKDVTQGADTAIGVSLKTVLSRMNSIRAGKFIDEETGEALNDVEKVLGLINISMRDVNGQFKEAEIIIDEVGAKWKTLDGNTQKAITTAMGGVYQANNLVALFDNYDKVIELTNIAKNSTGKAFEKFNENYLPSLEAKTQALQNSLQQLATTTFSDDFYASVLDVSKEVVDLTSETEILKNALTGLSVGASLYVFSQLAGFLRETTQGFSNFSNALNMVNSRSIKTTNDMQTLINLSHGLSNSQMRLLLSTNNLTDCQKISLMVANGVEQELAEQQLQTWGLINVQNAATSATVALTSSVQGLMATLAANPIILVTMAVTAGVAAFNKYKQAQEEILQTAREASTVYKDTADSVVSYVTKYEELHKALLEAKGNEEATCNVKQQLLTLQIELNEKFTNEADKINLVTDAYRSQIEAVKKLSKVSANEFLNKNREGIEKADKEMNREKTYQLGSANGLVNADELDIVEQIKAIAESNGIDFTNIGFEFVGNANEAADVINSFMNDIKALQTESGKISDVMSDIFDGLLDNSSDALGKADSIIDKYGNIYEQAQMATIAIDTDLSNGYNNAISAVEAYNEAVLKSENPYNDGNVKEAWDNLKTVKKGIQENEEEWRRYFNIMNNVFASANDKVYSFYDTLINDAEMSSLMEELRGLTDLEVQSMVNDGNSDAFDALSEKAKIYGLEIQDVIDLLIEMGVVQGKIVATQEESMISISDVFALKDSSDNATPLSNLKDQLSEVETAYQTCLSAKEEYDKQGYLSVDTLEKVLSLGGEYLQYLFDEQGNVNLDAEAFQNLALAKINVLEAEALKNLADNIKQITDEETATDYLTKKQNELANSYTDVAASALLALHSISGFSDSEVLQGAYNSFKAQYEQIKGLFVSTKAGLSKSYSWVSASSAKSATEKAKSYIESYMKFQEKQLEKGNIDYDTYCNNISNLLTKMHKQGRISAEEYWSYTEKMLETQKGIYDKVLSAVQRRFDKEIEKIEKAISAIEKQNETLEKQKDNYDTVISTVVDFLESQQDALEKNIDTLEEENDTLQDQIDMYDGLLGAVSVVFDEQREAAQSEIDLLQERIDKLQEANDEENRAIALQKARAELERARNQRTKLVYTHENGFVYKTDDTAIRDAESNLADLEFEATINALEKEKELLQDIIDQLDETEKVWQDISDAFDKQKNLSIAEELFGENYKEIILSSDPKVIADIMNQYVSAQEKMEENESTIQAIEEKKQKYDELIAKWEDVAKKQEEMTNREITALIIGKNWQQSVLEDRMEDYNNFCEGYLSIQEQILNNESEIASLEEKKTIYQDLKQEWAEIADAYENSIEDQYAAMILGRDWESAIFDERKLLLDSFKESYISIQKAISDAAWESANSQVAAAKYASNEIKKIQGIPDSSANYNNEKKIDSKSEGSLTIEKYHSGLEKGYVGESPASKNDRLRILQKAGQGVLLEPKEVPTILKRNELVLTEAQQLHIAKNLMKNPAAIMPNINFPDYSYLHNIPVKNTQSFRVGDIHVTCPGITSDDVAKQIGSALQKEFNGLSLLATQKMSITR